MTPPQTKSSWLRLNYHTYAPCQCVLPDRCFCFARECGVAGWTKDEAWAKVGARTLIDTQE